MAPVAGARKNVNLSADVIGLVEKLGGKLVAAVKAEHGIEDLKLPDEEVIKVALKKTLAAMEATPAG